MSDAVRAASERLPRHLVRPGARRPRRLRRAGRRLGAPPPRPRRARLRRPARPHRARPARLPPRRVRRGVRARAPAAPRGRAHGRGRRWSAATPRPSTPSCRRASSSSGCARRRCSPHAETPPFEIEGFSGEVGEEMRLRYRYLDLRRERMAQAIATAARGRGGDPRIPRRRGLPRDRDADAVALDPRGRPRLPRPVAARAGLVLRAAAVAAAVQAAADGRRVRALLPDRALLSRRGPARRPPAGLHPARHRDVVRRGRGRARPQRAACSPSSSSASAAPRLELPLPRIGYDEAIARFGTDRPDLRFGLELTELTDLLAGTEFKVFRGGDRVRRGRQGAQRRRPRRAPLGARRVDRAGPGARGEGPGVGVSRGRRLALADGEVPLRGRARGAQRAPRRRGGRPAAGRRRPARGSPTAVLGQLRLDLAERFELDRPRGGGVLLDRRLAAVRLERGRGALGPAAPPVHRARRASSTPSGPGRRGRSPTTSSGTARRWAAARSGSPTPSCSSGCSRRSGSRPRRRASASASCSRRCATAPPRTAGSPTGSTGSSSGSLHADSIRDVIAFPKAASGADPLTGAPAPVDEAQLRELGLELRAKRRA